MVNGELEPEASFAIQKILFILFILSKTKRLRWWFCRRANTEDVLKRKAKWGWIPQGDAPGTARSTFSLSAKICAICG